jgi:hypothetical protein
MFPTGLKYLEHSPRARFSKVAFFLFAAGTIWNTLRCDWCGEPEG